MEGQRGLSKGHLVTVAQQFPLVRSDLTSIQARSICTVLDQLDYNALFPFNDRVLPGNIRIALQNELIRRLTTERVRALGENIRRSVRGDPTRTRRGAVARAVSPER
jgi:hypothetical protein